MIFLVCILFVMIAAFSVTSSPDILTPGKLFLFYFFSFHVGAVVTDITSLTASLMLVVLSIGLLAVMLEVDQRGQSAQMIPPGEKSRAIWVAQRDYTVFVWLISVPSVFAQLYMIDNFGGLEGYVRSIGVRVVEWSGYGWARTLINLLTPINLAYFAFGLIQRRPLRWWLYYAAHFIVVIIVAFLSGSRSGLLNVFLVQLILFHYLRRRVNMQFAALLAGGLILSAMALGVIRNALRFEDGSFTTTVGTGQRPLSFASFYYGVDPLEIISRTEHAALAHGSTFLSFFTNSIPRTWYPTKPDTGGVFFTKNYIGDIWSGFSNVTPTFLGEWIINFGWGAGVIGYFFAYGIVFVLIARYYRVTQMRLTKPPSDVLAINVLIYAAVVLAFIGLMIGETTNVLLGLITTQLVPLYGIRWYVARRPVVAPTTNFKVA